METFVTRKTTVNFSWPQKNICTLKLWFLFRFFLKWSYLGRVILCQLYIYNFGKILHKNIKIITLQPRHFFMFYLFFYVYFHPFYSIIIITYFIIIQSVFFSLAIVIYFYSYFRIVSSVFFSFVYLFFKLLILLFEKMTRIIYFQWFWKILLAQYLSISRLGLWLRGWKRFPSSYQNLRFSYYNSRTIAYFFFLEGSLINLINIIGAFSRSA